jgi:hypothetical protein
MAGSGGRSARTDPEYEAIAARIAELRALLAQAEPDKDPGSNPAAEIETYRHPNIGVFE